MVFSSLTFLYLFLPLCLLLYYVSPTLKIKNFVLMLLSLVFYAWGEPIYFSLLILCSLINFVCGLLVDKFRNNKILSKAALIFALVMSLSALVVFKYSGLIVGSINSVFGLSVPVPNIALPIGISFFTFQTLSYTLDVYFGKAEKQRSFINFLLFVSLFPQLIAGPILRYTDLANQLDVRSHSFEKFYHGIIRFCIGLCKKVLIANHAGEIATAMLGKDGSTLGVWYGVIMFTLQIYFDFSGYSDMAIGLGRMFGFEYIENFNYPYISRSVTEFWRRWHISLGSWFRDYVYIPLGGKYKHQLFNIFVVWMLTGLWHGASWNFLLWGLFYAVLLCLEKKFLLRILAKVPRAVSFIYTIFAVMIGWVLFYFTDFTEGVNALKTMFFGVGEIASQSALLSLRANSLFLVIAIIACTPLVKNITVKLKERAKSDISIPELVSSIVFICLSMGVCTGYLASSSYNPFLYFRF